MKKFDSAQCIKLMNALDLLGICLVLIIAFGFQFVLKELPCPLCLLQRLGLLAIGFGFLLNIHFHIRPSHYALSLLAAVLTAFVSFRQVLLHIMPGEGGYGSSILGLHMYTWVLVLSVLTIIYIAIVMSHPKQYHLEQDAEKIHEAKNPWVKKLSHLAFVLFIVVAIANMVSLFSECGFKQCPDNPTHYLFAIHK